MLIITIRTDKPQAEIGIYQAGRQLAYSKWEAHRRLAETIHTAMQQVLAEAKLSLDDIAGIVVYKGPGSFTGLRIGASVANALAMSLELPITGETGQQWIVDGLKRLSAGDHQAAITLDYGAEPNITKPKK